MRHTVVPGMEVNVHGHDAFGCGDRRIAFIAAFDRSEMDASDASDHVKSAWMRGSRTENDLETSRAVSRAFGEAGAVAVAARARVGRHASFAPSPNYSPAIAETTVHASTIDPIRQTPMGHDFDGA